MTIPSIVVSADRTPENSALAPASVTTLFTASLAIDQVYDLRTSLSQVPGALVVKSGAFGGMSSVYLRGAASYETLFVVDGIPMNDRAADYTNFLGGAGLAGIDRIEVLRGPQGSLYGSALAGVITIDTAHGSGTPSGAVAAEAGSWFEVAYRGDTGKDEDRYTRCKDGAPSWVSPDLCQAAHGDMFPDDWRYQAIESALAPTRARLVGVGVVREPVDVKSLAGELLGTRFAGMRNNSDTLTAFGTGIGRQVAIGGTLLDQVRSHLFSRASGNFGRLDGVIVVRQQPQGMGPVQRASAGRLESALLNGIAATRTPVVGVETSTADPSSVGFFQNNNVSSVDDMDQVAGGVAMVFAMLGAEGSFGVKGTADRLLPELLAPVR